MLVVGYGLQGQLLSRMQAMPAHHGTPPAWQTLMTLQQDWPAYFMAVRFGLMRPERPVPEQIVVPKCFMASFEATQWQTIAVYAGSSWWRGGGPGGQGCGLQAAI